MKIRVLIFVLVTLWLRVSYAQSDCPADFVMPSQERIQALQKSSKDRGFLWKVTKDGKVSHLYGTMHVAKFEWMIPGPKLISALSQSNKLALEINFQDEEVMKVAADLVSSKNAPTVSIGLNERIKRYAMNNCIKPELLQTLRPEMQVITLSVMSMKREGIEPAFGIDGALSGIAKAMNKTIVGLETPKEQMDLIFSKPDEIEQDVSDLLKKLEDGTDKNLLNKIVNSWVESDFSVFDNYAEWCKCMDTPKDRSDMKRMIDDRNLVMSRRFDEMHTNAGQVLLAVGTLHMVGQTGLPSLLKKLGYTVEQLH
jgi:uncharacterized protein